MYGMVNEGIKTFIVSNHDDQTWHSICERAGIGHTDFERMSSYDDEVTYKLVGAICDHTGLEADEVLRVFGNYWIEFAGGSNFGNLMRLAGNTFLERLDGLDDMHDRILVSMPHLKPPSFELEPTEQEGVHRLHYYSPREGLTAMVIGLLHGLAADTGEEISVHHAMSRAEGADHDVFEIRLLA